MSACMVDKQEPLTPLLLKHTEGVSEQVDCPPSFPARGKEDDASEVENSLCRTTGNRVDSTDPNETQRTGHGYITVALNTRDTTELHHRGRGTLCERRNLHLKKIPLQKEGSAPRNDPRNDTPIGATISSLRNDRSAAGSRRQLDVFQIRLYLSHLVIDDEGEEGDIDETKTGVQFEIEGGKTVTTQFLIDQMALAKSIDPTLAKDAFALWMVSPLLELQLRSYHKPYEIHCGWSKLLNRFAVSVSEEEVMNDVPCLYFKRNVHLSIERELQMMIDPVVLDLLYLDARVSLFQSRYTLSLASTAKLAGIGFAINNRSFETRNITPEYVRKHLEDELPEYMSDTLRGPMVFGKSLSSSKELEVVVQSWKEHVGQEQNALKQEYLCILREAPQYGAAFFSGYIERPSVSPLKNFKRFVKSMTSSGDDIQVSIAINRELITVIDHANHEIILSTKIDECCWKKISRQDEETQQNEPLLFLHFPVVENEGENLLKTSILQIFGSQTVLMESLLESIKRRSERGSPGSSLEEQPLSSSSNSISVRRAPSITKPERMCLATFVNGQCVKASGSLKKVDWQKMQEVH